MQEPIVHNDCWVCLESDLSHGDRWVSPCQCSGYSKWVHERCLLKYIDQKQNGNPIIQVNCPTCLIEYKLYPHYDSIEKFFYSMDIILLDISKVFVQIYILLLSRVLSALYGCMIIAQALGISLSLQLLTRFTVMFLVIAQCLPMLLLVFHLILWEFISVHIFTWIVSKWGTSDNPTYPDLTTEVSEERFQAANMPQNICFCRIIHDALIAPVIGYLVGLIFFFWIKMSFVKFLLGFSLFLLVKSLCSLHLRLSIYRRTRDRKSEYYSENNYPRVPYIEPTVHDAHDILEQILLSTL